MRWTAAAIGMTVAAFVVAAAWVASIISQANQGIVIVISQGTVPFMQHEWWAFRYTGALLAALIIAVAAFITVILRPPASRKLRRAVGVAAGLEILVFGVVWFSIVVMPLLA